MRVHVSAALPVSCALAEGLHWDSRRNLLWFVDILGPHVYWFNPDTGQSGRRTMPEPVGWVLSIADSELVLVGLKSGLARLDAFDESSCIEWVDRQFPSHKDQRLNDAKADACGRLWYGSMSALDKQDPVGRLARYEFGDAAPVTIDSGYMVTNGPAFDAGSTVMLHNDSARRITYRFDMNVVTGEATNRTVWRRYAEDEGCPDGMNFDSEGCVWIAHWGAARVCRYDPAGRRLMALEIPADNVTNICFGGGDLSRMFVTSASADVPETRRSNRDPAGALYEVTGLDARGIPCNQVRIHVRTGRI